MNINTILDQVDVALASDSDLTTWSNSTYSQGCKVFRGIDDQDPPEETDCPFLGVWPFEKRVGQEDRRKTHGIMVLAGIFDETKTAHSTYTNLVRMAGIANVETLRKYAETAIVALDFGNLAVGPVDIEYIMDLFPYFFALMEITLVEHNTLGCNIFE